MLKKCGDGPIGYTHRSVPEFLALRRIQSDMSLCLKKFDAVAALSQLCIAGLRLRLTGGTEERLVGRLAQMNMVEREYEDSRSVLDFVAHRLQSTPDFGKITRDTSIDSLGLAFLTQLCTRSTGGPGGRRPRKTHIIIMAFFNVFLFACYHGNYQCVLRELERDWWQKPGTAVLAAYAVLAAKKPNYRILDLLFDRGGLGVHTPTDFMPLSKFFKVLGHGESTTRDGHPTIWSQYLVGEFFNWLKVSGDSYETRANDDSYETWAARFSEVTERFLVRGADPHFSASAHWEDTCISCIKCGTSNNEDDHDNHTDRRICADFQLGVDQQELRLYVEPRFRPSPSFHYDQGSEITLRSWIEQSGVPNTKRLLQLIGGSDRESITDRSETAEGMDDAPGEQTSERSEISESIEADTPQPLHARINHAQIAMLAIGFLLGIVTAMF